MRVSVFCGVFASALLFSTQAWAGPAAGGTGNDTDADSAALTSSEGGTSVYDFEDDNVDGELLSPDGANVASRGRIKHASLINIRPHFLPELIGLARDI